MEESNFDRISLSDSELSNVDEEQYANVPTAEIPIDTSPEYSPITEPISLSSSVENYLPEEAPYPIQNTIDEVPLTLPIEYIAAAREMLILMVMTRELSPNEITVFAYPEDEITAPLPNQLSTSAIEPTTESGLDPQLENWTLPPFPEILPLSTIKEFPPFTTIEEQTVPISNDIVFNDIDQIIAHSRRRVNNHRVTKLLCVMSDGEQHWIPASHLRRDSRTSDLVDRYYRDLKHPYYAKRTNKKRKL